MKSGIFIRYGRRSLSIPDPLASLLVAVLFLPFLAKVIWESLQ